MATISAKFSEEDGRKLEQICQALHIDKSEALRRATGQLWAALQIGRTFEERAGGPPRFLLNSGDSNASSRKSRKDKVASYLDERARKRKAANRGGRNSANRAD